MTRLSRSGASRLEVSRVGRHGVRSPSRRETRPHVGDDGARKKRAGLVAAVVHPPEKGNPLMLCYCCAKDGIEEPAVALCRSCKAGLCLHHLRETTARAEARNVLNIC